MCMFSAYVCQKWALNPLELVRGGCEPPRGFWELNPGLLQEQQLPLTWKRLSSFHVFSFVRRTLRLWFCSLVLFYQETYRLSSLPAPLCLVFGFYLTLFIISKNLRQEGRFPHVLGVPSYSGEVPGLFRNVGIVLAKC